jgi:hypothetical protein
MGTPHSHVSFLRVEIPIMDIKTLEPFGSDDYLLRLRYDPHQVVFANLYTLAALLFPCNRL